MLSIFKTNRTILSILLIPYAFVLRSFGFFRPIPFEYDNGGLLADLFYENIDFTPLTSAIFAFAFVLIQAYLLIIINNQLKLSKDDHLFTGVFYVWTTSISIYFLGLSPALIGNTFLIMALMSLLQVFKMKEPSGHHFSAGFWLALASLTYGSLFLFLLFGLLAINVIRAFNIWEMFQIICGYFVPYVLIFTYFYAIGDASESFLPYIISSFRSFADNYHLSISNYISLGLLALLIIILILNYGKFMERQVMKSRKSIIVMFIFIPFVLLSFIIQSGASWEHFILLAIPLSILLGLLFIRIKSTFWREVWHFLLFLTIPIVHYFIT